MTDRRRQTDSVAPREHPQRDTLVDEDGTAVDTPSRPSPAVDLRAIAQINLLIGLSSFGGGLVSWFVRELTEQRGWITNRDLLSGFALCQMMPGPSTVNLTLYFGFMLRGIRGAAAAWLTLVGPPSLLTLGIYIAYTHASLTGVMQVALEGVAATAAGFNIATGINAGWRNRGWRTFTVAGLVFVAVTMLHVPILWVVLIAAPLSLATTWRDNERPDEERAAPYE